MRTIYIADDNKEFDDEFECERHEWLLKHPHLKDIKCYGKDGNLFTDIMDDDTYNYSVKIIVPTEECVKELHDVAEYTGFIYIIILPNLVHGYSKRMIIDQTEDL